jgi:uncharacterized membrane protein YgcG
MSKVRTATIPTLGLLLLAGLASACIGENCLEESTLVKTPDGLRSIGAIEVGDSVISVDPSTGAEIVNRVERKATAWGWCEKLVVGEQSVWLTAEHPLYSPELGDFHPAEAWLQRELHQTLSETGAMLSASAGSWLDQRPCRVVDLSVADEPHTFVAAGMVVHNKTLSSPPCDNDEDCPEGFVCDPIVYCIPDDGTGGASGSGGASGAGGESGAGGSGGV